MMEQAEYYLILNRIVGKKENGRYYIFRDGGWQPDTENMILDRVFGYDPTEDENSPYAMFNTSIMEELEKISYEEAMKRIRR